MRASVFMNFKLISVPSFSLLPSESPQFATMMIITTAMTMQRRLCSGQASSAERMVHFRPHRLGARKRIATGAESSSSSSTFSCTLDAFAPPSPLTVDASVEYLAALRGLHRSLGIVSSASRVSRQAREFLLRGMPNPTLHETTSASTTKGVEVEVPWRLTEEFACAVIVSCAHFEISISECPYGRKSVELLQDVWKGRRQQQPTSGLSLSSFISCCEDALLLGQLGMAVLDILSNRILYTTASDMEMLSQLLCETLLPAVMHTLQSDIFCSSYSEEFRRNNADESDAMLSRANAFTVLLSSLTKAAVKQWARSGSGASDGRSGVVFAPPPSLPSRIAGARVNWPHAVCVTVPPLSLAKLARAVEEYTRHLVPLHVKETALPILRFFTLTQCVPLFVAPHGNNNCVRGEEEEEETYMTALVTSITTVLKISMENRTAFVSHKMANIASIYARVLSFSPKMHEKKNKRGAHDGREDVVNSPSWLIFENLMLGVKCNILYRVESLSPVAVMPQLCECVTAFARKYLFSDLAALLNALSKIYGFLCKHHNSQALQKRQQQKERQHIHPAKENAGHSRFERRRTTTTTSTNTTISPLKRDIPPMHTEEKQTSSSSVLLTTTSEFIVSNDDIAEIEGELEVLLDACVAVMERHMPSACGSRHVCVPKSGTSSSTTTSSSYASSSDQMGTTHRGSLSALMAAGEIELAKVGVSEAKSLGGKSRFLKKTLSSRELVMIAEGLHALSWRPFMAFQERLLAALSSEVGQSESTPAQYACLVRLVLRAPPVLPSVIFFSVGDRLKRLIHADAVVVPSAHCGKHDDLSEESTTVDTALKEPETVVIAAAHARSLQDQPLSLYDACSVIFSFAQKMKKPALPLLHDLLVRCGKRLLLESESITEVLLQDTTTTTTTKTMEALMMFVASATWALSHYPFISAGDHVLCFIAEARDHAAKMLVDGVQRDKQREKEGSDEVEDVEEEGSMMMTSLFSFRNLAYACMMSGIPRNSHSNNSVGNSNDNTIHMVQVRQFVRETYLKSASQSDSIEVAQFVSDFLTTPSPDMLPYEKSCKAENDDGEDKEHHSSELLELSPWMIPPLQLGERFVGSNRLLTVMFLPFLGSTTTTTTSSTTTTNDNNNGGCSSACIVANVNIAHVLDVTRLYCRTFATLVTILQLLNAADSALLRDDFVLQVVLRKVTQLTRRTARPLELFRLFEFYGDCPRVVSACLSELQAETSICFNARNAFVPVVQVNSSVRAVRLLRSKELWQRWLTIMSPLIISAVQMSREPLDVVLELTECIGNDDPELLQRVLKSSASMQAIHKTFSYTVESDVLLRLLLQLQSANLSHPTVRRLHAAARRMLQNVSVCIPLDKLAQTILLPSVDNTVLGRRLQKLFIFRVTTLLGVTHPRTSELKASSGTTAKRDHTAPLQSHWDESLNCLELEHWLAFLRFSHVAEPTSYRLLVTIRQKEMNEARRKGKSSSASTAAATTTTGTTATVEEIPYEDMTKSGLENAETNSGNVGRVSDKRHRNLSVIYAFSDETIACLRQSLGAFHFIVFVSELLRQTASLSSSTPRMTSSDGSTSKWPASYYDCQCMYDGSSSPLSDERVRPFFRVAMGLVEEMSADLGGFLRREKQQEKQRLYWQKEKEKKEEGEATLSATKRQNNKKATDSIILNIGTVVEFLTIVDACSPSCRERQLLLLSSSSSLPSSPGAANIFDDVMRFTYRHLYRLLLQVPQYWGKAATSANTKSSSSSSSPSSSSTPVDDDDDIMPHVVLQNISSVFNYCTASTELFPPFGAIDTSSQAHRHLTDIFCSDRPLITDVWLPLDAVQSQRCLLDKTAKAALFAALMRCVVRDGESHAATMARLATLAPRDLASVAQTCIRGNNNNSNTNNSNNNNNYNDNSNNDNDKQRAAAVSALELLTDMLPSATAEDVHDIVLALLPPADIEQPQRNNNNTIKESKESLLLSSSSHGGMAEVRRFLAHVAVVMGNDTERFPLPLLHDILRRLHEPHRLIGPAAAQMMLANLNAADDTANQPHRQQEETAEREREREEYEEDEEEEGIVVNSTEQEVFLEGAVAGRSDKTYYTAVVTILRSVIASSSL